MSRVTLSKAQRRAAREALNRFLSVLLAVAMVLQTSPVAYARIDEGEGVTYETEAPVPDETPAVDETPAEGSSSSEQSTSEQQVVTESGSQSSSEVTVTDPSGDAPVTVQDQAPAQTMASISVYVENATLAIDGNELTNSTGTLTVPEGQAVSFAVTAAEGYELKDGSVRATVDGNEIALAGNGTYTLAADLVKTGTSIVVRAEKADTKTEYVYEDDYVRVTATLDKASAIPDDAVLSVTPIYENSTYYNYDAYMDALNDRVEGENVYDSQNTLLYDVAFLWVDPATGKTVELQPNEGAVTVKFTFRQRQLSDGIQAGSAANVEVNHLPLVDSAKADTTYQSTNINAGDVVVEPMGTNPTSLNTLEVRTDSFSVYAFSYTVDFTYDGYTLKLEGEGSIMLSQILAALNIPVNVADVASVDFTNYDLLAFEKQGDDWKVTSLKSFDTPETLTVTLANGNKYVIDVTDPAGVVYDADGNIDLVASGYLHGTQLLYRENEDQDWIEYVPGTELDNGWMLKVVVDYSIPQNVITASQRTITYQAPSLGFKIGDELSNVPIKNKAKQTVGTMSVDSAGKVTIVFDEEFATGDAIEGDFNFWGYINFTSWQENYKIKFPGEGNEVEIRHDSVVLKDLNISKKHSTLTLDDDGNYHTTYTIEVTTTKGMDDPITVTDEVSVTSENYPYTYDTPTVTFVDENGVSSTVPASSYTLTPDGPSWKIEGLPKLVVGANGVAQKYVITYDATISKGSNPPESGLSQTVTNEVFAKSGTLDASGSDDLTVSREINKVKSSSSPNTNTNHWTITINPNHHDMTGWTFEDHMIQDMYLNSDVTITCDKNGKTVTLKLADLQAAEIAAGGDGNVQDITYTFRPNSTFPASAMTGTFTIKYSTFGKGENTAYSNSPSLSYHDTETGGVTPGRPPTRKATLYTPVIQEELGRLKFTWGLQTFNLPKNMKANEQYTVTDTLIQPVITDADGVEVARPLHYTYLGYYGPHGDGDPYREYTAKYVLDANFMIITDHGRYRYASSSLVPTHCQFSPSGTSGTWVNSDDIEMTLVGIDENGQETTDGTTKIKAFKLTIKPRIDIVNNAAICNNASKAYNSYVDYAGYDVYQLNTTVQNGLGTGSGTNYYSDPTQTFSSNHYLRKSGTARPAAAGATYIDYVVNVDLEQLRTMGSDEITVVDKRTALPEEFVSDCDYPYGYLVTSTSTDYYPKVFTTSSSGAAREYSLNNTYWSYENNNKTGTVTFKFHNLTSLATANKNVRIKYTIRVDKDGWWDDSSHYEKTYYNEVTVNNELGMTASASTKVIRETNALTKTGHLLYAYNEDGTPVLNPDGSQFFLNQVGFYVYINPDAKDLDPTSANITLTDTVSRTDATFMDESLHLYEYDAETETVGAEVTDGWSYTFDSNTNKLQVIMPDAHSYVLEYVYDVSHVPSTVHHIANEANLNGSYTAHDDEQYNYQEGGGNANTRTIDIFKVDEDNYNVKLQGATFKLESYGANGWTTHADSPFTTDVDGNFTIQLPDNLYTNRLYRLTELETATGYLKVNEYGNPIEYYFAIKMPNATDEATYAVLNEDGKHPQGFDPSDQNTRLFLYHGGVEYIGNKKIPDIDIPVQKIWNDNNNQYGLRPGSIVVELLQDGKSMSPKKTLTLNAGNDWKGTFTKLPKYKNSSAEEYVYTLKEISKPAGYASAAISGTATEGFKVTNTAFTPVKEKIPVKKVLSGREWKEGDSFTFTLAAVDGAPMPAGTGNEVTITNADGPDYTKYFGEITFGKAGTYKYTVTEEHAGQTIKGVKYDSTTKNVTIKVVEGADGKLKIDSGTPVTAVEFTNTYSATGTAKIEAIKEVSGAAWPQGAKAIFEVTAAANTPMPANTRVELTTAGTADFGNITYGLKDAGKTYTYTITETPSGFGAGWTGSGTITATVKVGSDNGDGTLKASTVTYDPPSKTITNKYTAAGKGEILVKKTLVGRAWNNDDEFTFTLAAKGNAPMPGKSTITIKSTDADYTKSFGEIEFTAAGTYKYTVTETDSHAGGIAYDTTAHEVTIKVKDNGAGEYVGDGTPLVQTVEIRNTYTPAPTSGEVKVQKTLEGRAWKTGDSFKFTITPSDTNPDKAAVPAKTEVTITKDTADYTDTFGSIRFTKAGTYEYTVTEEHAGETINGVTYDSTPKTVTIVVVDNNHGQLVANEGDTLIKTAAFTNSYKTGGTGEIKVQKTLNGRAWTTNDSFEFTLAPVGNAPMPKTTALTITSADEQAGYTKSFGNIKFDGPGTYEYTVTETHQGERIDGVTYDSTPKTVTIVVVDDGNGGIKPAEGSSLVQTAAFTNTYTVDKVNGEIKVQKILEGREWTDDDEFTFDLSADKGTPMPAETSITIKKADADQTKSFGKIEFTEAGTYTYTVKETKGTIGGITYDETEHTVTIVVADNGKGKLVAGEGSNLIQTEKVTNTYGSTGKGEIKVKKNLIGRDWTEDDSFQFRISVADGSDENTPLPGAKSITITKGDTDYTKTFGQITFSKAGTYKYTITETHAGETINGVRYDSRTHTVTINAVDDGNGNIVADQGSSLIQTEAFTNTYDASGNGNIEVKKNLVGREWTTDDSFEFTLSAKTQGAPMPTEGTVVTITKDDADSGYTKAFGDISYGLADKGKTYEYTITETHQGEKLGGITYDSATRSAFVKVEDKGDGGLKVTVTYGEDGNVFKNTYDAGGSGEIKVKKIFSGREWDNDDKFEFELKAVTDGAPMPEKTKVTITKDDADSGYTKSFGTIPFGLTDDGKTYEYTIEETVGTRDGVEYEVALHTVKISVKDNQDGTLTATTAYEKGTEAEEFTNTFAPTYAPVEVTKAIEGRDWADDDSFEFTLAAVTPGAPLPEETVKTATAADPDHVAKFGRIEFTKAGSYEYAITETVPDGATNADGKTWAEATEAERAAGTWTYEGITYDQAAHQVIVTVSKAEDETNALSATVTYDGGDSLTVKNTYAGKGEAVLFATKTLGIIGETTKKLEAGDFSFKLEGDKLPEAGITMSNDADGKVAFPAIEYTLDDLDWNDAKTARIDTEFDYTITEIVPADAVNEAGEKYSEATDKTAVFMLDGVYYSEQKQDLTITVSDNGDGTLGIKYGDSDTFAGFDFENEYFEATAHVEFDKLFYGEGGEFTFRMTPADAEGKPAEGTSLADMTAAKLVYSDLQHLQWNETIPSGVQTPVISRNVTFEKVGTYYYLISEIDSNDAIDYDEATLLATIVVDEDANATVTYKISKYEGAPFEDIDAEDAVFFNNGLVRMGFRSAAMRQHNNREMIAVYQPEIRKVLENGTLKKDEFSFSIYAGDTATGTPLETVTNDELGLVRFSVIKYDQPKSDHDETAYSQTYTYTIVENAGTNKTIVYSQEQIKLTVTVTEKDGDLVAKGAYTMDGVEVDVPTITNHYDTIKIHATKYSREDLENGIKTPLVGAHYGLWMVNPDGNDIYLGTQTSDEGGNLYYDIPTIEGAVYYFKEEYEPPKGHLVDPYPTDYFALVIGDEEFSLQYFASYEDALDYIASANNG